MVTIYEAQKGLSRRDLLRRGGALGRARCWSSAVTR